MNFLRFLALLITAIILERLGGEVLWRIACGKEAHANAAKDSKEAGSPLE